MQDGGKGREQARKHLKISQFPGHYVARGVVELDTNKLPQLIELKYHSMGDAVKELGPAGKIREVFVGFQQHLY